MNAKHILVVFFTSFSTISWGAGDSLGVSSSTPREGAQDFSYMPPAPSVDDATSAKKGLWKKIKDRVKKATRKTVEASGKVNKSRSHLNEKGKPESSKKKSEKYSVDSPAVLDDIGQNADSNENDAEDDAEEKKESGISSKMTSAAHIIAKRFQTRNEVKNIKYCIVYNRFKSYKNENLGQAIKDADWIYEDEQVKSRFDQAKKLLLDSIEQGESACKTLKRSSKIGGCHRWFNRLTCKNPVIAWKANELQAMGICSGKVSMCLKGKNNLADSNQEIHQKSFKMKPSEVLKDALNAMDLLSSEKFKGRKETFFETSQTLLEKSFGFRLPVSLEKQAN